MGKHTDALKSFEEFRAPWETESGADAEIEKSKLKRFIYNLFSDKAKAQDARDEKDEALKKATEELETAKAEAADANGEEAQKKIVKLEKKVEDLTAERDKLVADQEEAELRAEVVGDLDPKIAKYVVGTTREELEKSLEEVKKDFGVVEGDGDDEEEEEEEPKATVRTAPRTRLKSGVDPDPKATGGEIDFDKAVDSMLATSIF